MRSSPFAARRTGRTGGTLSVIDIAAALYLNVLRHDPRWPDRDRATWSAAAGAAALHATLGFCGYYDLRDLATLRKPGGSPRGHPHHRLAGVEFSTLPGQGLAIAVGQALACRLTRRGYRVFCVSGDLEHRDGRMWEAAMEAGHFRLAGLVSIVDVGGLQDPGRPGEVVEVQPLAGKYRAFGWNAIECDGHDLAELVRAFTAAADAGKPTAVLWRAAWILKRDHDLETRVAKVHTIEPLDVDAVVAAASQTRVLLTLEVHLTAGIAHRCWPRSRRADARAATITSESTIGSARLAPHGRRARRVTLARRDETRQRNSVTARVSSARPPISSVTK